MVPGSMLQTTPANLAGCHGAMPETVPTAGRKNVSPLGCRAPEPPEAPPIRADGRSAPPAAILPASSPAARPSKPAALPPATATGRPDMTRPGGPAARADARGRGGFLHFPPIAARRASATPHRKPITPPMKNPGAISPLHPPLCGKRQPPPAKDAAPHPCRLPIPPPYRPIPSALQATPRRLPPRPAATLRPAPPAAHRCPTFSSRLKHLSTRLPGLRPRRKMSIRFPGSSPLRTMTNRYPSPRPSHTKAIRFSGSHPTCPIPSRAHLPPPAHRGETRDPAKTAGPHPMPPSSAPSIPRRS